MANQSFAIDTSALAGLALSLAPWDVFEAVLLHAGQIVLVEPRTAAYEHRIADWTSS